MSERHVKALLTALAVVVAAVPATIVVTLLLYPLWSWIEATFGLESVGHSGPADWCFLLVFSMFVIGSLALLLRVRRRPLARPAVGVAHVVLHTDRMAESAEFMRAIGMRAIFDGPEVSVYEMRGGTHLIMMKRERVAPGDAPFDLMVDDLRATHGRFQAMGLSPSPIERRAQIDHEVFTVREPAGHVITFFSSHWSGNPV